MSESASFGAYIVKICPPAVGDDKEKGKKRYTKSQLGYISIWAADPV